MKMRQRKQRGERLLVILMASLLMRDDNRLLFLRAHIYVLSGAICSVTQEEQRASVGCSRYTQRSAQKNTGQELLRAAHSLYALALVKHLNESKQQSCKGN